MRVNRDMSMKPSFGGRSRGGSDLGNIGTKKKKLPPLKTVWHEARELIWAHRRRLAIGLVLMIISRLAGLVLPATSKYLIDEVIGNHRSSLLWPLALAAGAATVVQALSSFALSQVLGVAAQRAITEMRKSVQEHITRLPIRYFDSTQSGILVSRIMTDPEGIRNLVGTGLAQLSGSIVTAFLALSVLFYLNWKLTLITILILSVFGACLAVAFTRLRPVFRLRGKINADVTGRLSETLMGIRVVKAYTAEKREEIVFARGAHRLLRNVAKAVTGVSFVSALSTVVTGAVAVVMISYGGRSIINGSMSLGDFVMYVFFTGMLASPVIQLSSIGTQISEAFAGLDRIREVKSLPTEDEEDAHRLPVHQMQGQVEFQNVSFEYDPGSSCSEERQLYCRSRHNNCAGRIQRLREKHPGKSCDGV